MDYSVEHRTEPREYWIGHDDKNGHVSYGDTRDEALFMLGEMRGIREHAESLNGIFHSAAHKVKDVDPEELKELEALLAKLIETRRQAQSVLP